jgi:DNA repair exonuclease SbcCD ATPase subunit
MKFLTLEEQNFGSIEKAKIALNDIGLVAIQGEVESAGASSNGAGKSTIIGEALCWCLYGETAKGISGDEVVNQQTGKDCKVSATFSDDDSIYRVDRYRKHKKFKNELRLYKLAGDEEVDLTLGTTALTQSAIVRLLGCSYDVFKASVYLGQEQMPDLPGMRDKELKMIVEEAAGVERVNQAYERAKTARLERSRLHSEASSTLHGLIDKEESKRADLENQKESNKTFELNKAEEIKSGKEKLRAALVELKELVKPEESVFDGSRIAKLEELLLNLQAKSREIADSILVENDSRHSASIVLGLEIAKITAVQDEIKKLKGKAGSVCSECGKLYEEHEILEVRLRKEAEIGSLQKHETIKRATLLGIEAGLRILVTGAAEIEEKIKKVKEAIEKEKQAKRDAESDMRVFVEKDKALREKIELFKSALAKHETVKSPFTDSIEKLEQELAELTVKIAEAEKLVETRKQELTTAEDACKILGPTGVRAHILDSITPFLNQNTNEYLSALSDGEIIAEWKTLVPSSTGELKEKFSIEVFSQNGGKTFKGLSGGEKRKVRIATAMALQDLVSTRATKPIDLLIMDEVDDALDEAGLERFMGILDKKSKEKGSVTVISHNSLSSWIRTVLTVKKVGQVSSVV